MTALDGLLIAVVIGLTSAGQLGQKRAVAQYITRRAFSAVGSAPPPRMCAAGLSPFDYGQTPAFAGWGCPSSEHSAQLAA